VAKINILEYGITKKKSKRLPNNFLQKIYLQLLYILQDFIFWWDFQTSLNSLILVLKEEKFSNKYVIFKYELVLKSDFQMVVNILQLFIRYLDNKHKKFMYIRHIHVQNSIHQNPKFQLNIKFLIMEFCA